MVLSLIMLNQFVKGFNKFLLKRVFKLCFRLTQPLGDVLQPPPLNFYIHSTLTSIGKNKPREITRLYY